MLISNMIFLVVPLRRVAPNMSEQRSPSGLCEGVIRREATETECEGLVYIIYLFVDYDLVYFDSSFQLREAYFEHIVGK